MTKTLISGKYIDRSKRTYELVLEPAIDNGDGTYTIQREITITVWRIIN
jgi:hypothetical protein